MKIVGLRIEKYIGQAVEGHNCDFEYHDEEFERHILFGILEDKRKIQITLSASEGECGSGWCSASYGEMEVKEVKQFGGFNYIPIKELIVDDIEPDYEIATEEEYRNDVFNISECGGDCYYPSGYYDVNMELFKSTVRTKEKRPVWIFTGKSNVGKSFIASHTDLQVYETDRNESLPISITEDIIVLGNKYDFSEDDIKERIFGEYELCVVKFTIEN